ncbi:MAG: type II toxin-antitoxin system Phd/YefM family antitoxin [bacterium]
MVELSVNKFRANLKKYIEKTLTDHIPLKVTRRAGKDFIVISAEDWEREQETLYVLQNKSLIKQIAESSCTFASNKGYIPSGNEMN